MRLRYQRVMSLGFALSMAAAVVACDSGPSGPGSLPVTVQGVGSLGAVTIDVVGPGIRGFEGHGETEVFGAVVSAEQGRHRVVVLHPTGGTIGFGVLVEDLGGEPPTFTVVGAADTANEVLPHGGIEVRIEP